MALLASGINLNDTLKDPLSAIGQGASGRLEGALGRIRTRFNAGASASGRHASPYFDETIGDAANLGERGIEDSLYGVLGGASYKNRLGERDHLRKMELAKRIGSMNSPSTLQEVLGGIGLAGQTIPAFIQGGNALASGLKKSPSGSLPPSLSLYNSGSTGLARYQ